MRDKLKNEKVIILLALAFSLILALYNVYDYSDKTESDAYSSSQAENYEVELVNINEADVNKLCTLPGVGEKTAEGIVSYREENGGFKTIEEIKEVKGIGNQDFENLRPLISVK
ncbi:MAG: helix-hairpin-helix domain-containing protein [Ruminococcus sp.]|nr:helix-hairpin-helix domain-containing protein [Ruminococcus sp.]MBQ7133209.1 helix-hairpin-helix domain-containing protein [Ruminococcus sp.]